MASLLNKAQKARQILTILYACSDKAISHLFHLCACVCVSARGEKIPLAGKCLVLVFNEAFLVEILKGDE